MSAQPFVWNVVVYEGADERTVEVLALTRLEALEKGRELHPTGTVVKAYRSPDQSKARRS